ncbi:conserved hypothetical protein [Vibrio chagasii]|nr:conserved hypothetical protein [Vibrio chagasii]CAH6968783.1 conserved hypothetical protein [Vibrio chagasii]CAH7081482.1 conserved hypothetical protein [Vibrio chagasii]CAH7098618.1 conserved hypothetical protein [Vibrio chagasii]CAH7160553.1 conserved hypothetical protein [Vibrio chagasii]
MSVSVLEHIQEQAFTYQQSIVPLEAIEIHELSEESITSTNLKRIVSADNHRDYAVKEVTNSHKGYVPACELFCYELARTIKVNVPEYQIIRMKDGTYAFGSEWDANAGYLENITDFLRVLSGKDAIKNGAEFFSKVYALDIFVNNIDRHRGNLFVRKVFSGKIGVAYDFDKSWYETGYDRFEALEGGTNTQDTKWDVRDKRQLKKAIVTKTLEEIQNIRVDTIRSILGMMPEEWMLDENKATFLSWWGSESFFERIEKLKQEGF